MLKILEPCTTPGLTGVPGDDVLDQNYVIDSPTLTINFGPILNGSCHFDLFVWCLTCSDPTAPLSDFGMTVTMPVLQIDAATRTWGHVSDGFIDINLTDDSFDALYFTFRV